MDKAILRSISHFNVCSYVLLPLPQKINPSSRMRRMKKKHL
jgi:hypothetical protein